MIGVDLILGTGRFVGPNLVEVATQSGEKRLLEEEDVLIGTGSRAVIDDTPGLCEANPMTHTEALDLGVVPPDLVILVPVTSALNLRKPCVDSAVRSRS